MILYIQLNMKNKLQKYLQNELLQFLLFWKKYFKIVYWCHINHWNKLHEDIGKLTYSENIGWCRSNSHNVILLYLRWHLQNRNTCIIISVCNTGINSLQRVPSLKNLIISALQSVNMYNHSSYCLKCRICKMT